MTTLAILPIKSFPQSKQRLMAQLTSGSRRALADRSLGRADGAAASGVDRGDHRRLLRRGGPADRRRARSDGARGRRGRAQRCSPARDRPRGGAGATRVLCVPGRLPAAEPRRARAAARPSGAGRSAIVVPDRHGTGTNALLLTPPDALTPSFGPGSCARHQELAVAQGRRPKWWMSPTLALDVDTPDDLAALQQTLAATRGGAAHTRGMLSRMMRTLAARGPPLR